LAPKEPASGAIFHSLLIDWSCRFIKIKVINKTVPAADGINKQLPYIV
jgi:hypothetical protein